MVRVVQTIMLCSLHRHSAECHHISIKLEEKAIVKIKISIHHRQKKVNYKRKHGKYYKNNCIAGKHWFNLISTMRFI